MTGKSFRSGLVLFSLLCNAAASHAQLVVTPNQPAAVLANKLGGAGITISSPTLTCAGQANGTFVSGSTPLPIDSGILLTTGKAINAAGAASFLASTNNGTAGDAALATLAGTTTHDACYLEFDLIPNGDTVSFNYVFGSEEYNNSVCGPYNDAFAFFISGPGITGTQNMALVPGTSIPVTVNTINNGVPGSGYSIATCSAMGPGSPFTSYYYDNTGGTQLTYKGYTTLLKAQHDVIPCNTYHLKLTIADAGNSLYDSGVFIEAGSLKTNTYSFSTTDSIGHTINGIPHAFVKGCAPATVNITSAHAVGTNQTVHFTYGGTAVHGSDFSGPDSTVIAAGDTFTTIVLTGLNTPISGAQTVTVYLTSPFSCGIVDSVHLTLLDSPALSILTPDTAICMGQSFLLRALGSSGLTYSWSPAAGLSSATAMQPIANPAATTIYTLSAILPLAGCAIPSHNVTVTVNSAAVSISPSPDTTICNGAHVNITATGGAVYTYNWSPSTALSSPTSATPVATPTVTTVYTLVATAPTGCMAISTLTINISDPTTYIANHDTSICTGASVALHAYGAAGLTYNWGPASSLSAPTSADPVATPAISTIYTVVASVPGTTCSVSRWVSVNIYAPIVASAGPDINTCIGNEIALNASPAGNDYSYSWAGPDGFASSQQSITIENAQAVNAGLYTLVVTNNNTTCTATEIVNVSVNNGTVALMGLTPNQTIAYGSSIQLNVHNALFYTWIPNDGSLNDPTINNPIATPKVPTKYTVIGLNADGCRDSATVFIDITYDTVFLPTAFTPNNDGLNDRFHVVNLGYYRLVDMAVFDRWGALVYHTTDGSNKGWDGTFNGTAQDMGVYNYVVVIARPDGQTSTVKGTVTLVR